MALRAFCKADQHFSSYLAEVERQKEISSFVLGQLISHTSALDAHLIQELPLLGRSDTLPPLFLPQIKERKLSTAITFPGHRLQVSLTVVKSSRIKKQQLCSPP